MKRFLNAACAREFARASAVGLCIVVSVIAFLPSNSMAQERNHEDHEGHHAGLHFSHPLLTESPSPDTKLRFDLGRTWPESGAGAASNIFKAEGEYAFSPALSLAVTSSYEWLSAKASNPRVNATALELSIKGASFAWSERGFLAGGGLAVDIPLTSTTAPGERKEQVAAEPFADIALKRGALELVGLASYSTTLGSAGSRERRFQVLGSALGKLSSTVEVLAEAEILRPLGSGLENSVAVRLAPGVKVRPFHARDLAIGLSIPFGVSREDSRSMLVSAFYHF